MRGTLGLGYIPAYPLSFEGKKFHGKTLEDGIPVDWQVVRITRI